MEGERGKPGTIQMLGSKLQGGTEQRTFQQWSLDGRFHLHLMPSHWQGREVTLESILLPISNLHLLGLKTWAVSPLSLLLPAQQPSKQPLNLQDKGAYGVPVHCDLSTTQLHMDWCSVGAEHNTMETMETYVNLAGVPAQSWSLKTKAPEGYPSTWASFEAKNGWWWTLLSAIEPCLKFNAYTYEKWDAHPAKLMQRGLHSSHERRCCSVTKMTTVDTSSAHHTCCCWWVSSMNLWLDCSISLSSRVYLSCGLLGPFNNDWNGKQRHAQCGNTDTQFSENAELNTTNSMM